MIDIIFSGLVLLLMRFAFLHEVPNVLPPAKVLHSDDVKSAIEEVQFNTKDGNVLEVPFRGAIYDYVFETVKLSNGSIYLAQDGIEIWDNQNEPLPPNVPSVIDKDGKKFSVLKQVSECRIWTPEKIMLTAQKSNFEIERSEIVDFKWLSPLTLESPLFPLRRIQSETTQSSYNATLGELDLIDSYRHVVLVPIAENEQADVKCIEYLINQKTKFPMAAKFSSDNGHTIFIFKSPRRSSGLPEKFLAIIGSSEKCN